MPNTHSMPRYKKNEGCRPTLMKNGRFFEIILLDKGRSVNGDGRCSLRSRLALGLARDFQEQEQGLVLLLNPKSK